MTLTAFPNGASSFGLPLVGGGGLIPIAYRYFFVCSVTGSNGNEGTDPDSPLSTLDFAVGKCTASKGDVIIVLPGHVETVATAAGLAFDVAGINVIGVGKGSLRPKINLTATASTITVTAANVSLENILITGGIDAVVSGLVVSAADFQMNNCEYRDVTGEITLFCLTTAAADRLKVTNFLYAGAAGAGTATGFALVGGDAALFDGIEADGNFSTAFLDVRTTAATNLRCRNWIARTRNSADVIGVDTITGSTGIIGPNMFLAVQDNAANFAGAFSGATFRYFAPVSIVNAAGEIGGYNLADSTGTNAGIGYKAVSLNA